MGYETTVELDALEGEWRDLTKKEVKALAKKSGSADYCLSDGGQRGKWYELEDDLRALSLDFPKFEFRAHVVGEDGATWRVHALAGVSQRVTPEVHWPSPFGSKP
jgi:hypothetical protein